METNYLQAALRAAGTPLETCTLCGTIVNRDYREAHNASTRSHLDPGRRGPVRGPKGGWQR